MKRITKVTCLFFVLISCAGIGKVEVGLNDEGSVLGLFGDFKLYVRKIELFDGDTYQTVEEGSLPVTIGVQNSSFVSITNGFETITPGTFDRVTMTVDSLQYIDQSTTITVFDTVVVFSAFAFAEIVIDDGDELRLVADIVSKNWFDTDSLKIKSGHQPFEGAALKIYYPL